MEALKIIIDALIVNEFLSVETLGVKQSEYDDAWKKLFSQSGGGIQVPELRIPIHKNEKEARQRGLEDGDIYAKQNGAVQVLVGDK